MPDTSGNIYLTVPAPITKFLSGWSLTLTAPKPTVTKFISGCSLILTAPKPTITFADYYNSLILTVPVPQLVIESTSTSSNLILTVPPPRVIISSHASYCALILPVPPPQLVIRSYNTSGNLVLTVPKPKIVIVSSTSTGADLILTVPVPQIIITAKRDTSGSLILTVPVPEIIFESLSLLSKCIVLNTDTWQVTEYTWTFDKLVKFGDNYLAVDSAGVYLLGGDTNNGSQIRSVIETPEDEFDISHDMRTGGTREGGGISFKRPTYLDVILKSSGGMKITITMEGEYDKTYQIQGADIKEIRRLFTYDAYHGKYYNYSVRNIGGQDFDLYGWDQQFDILPRRI